MIERDYIMRMIAMLTGVIARILNLKKTGDFPLAQAEVDKGLRSLLGLDGSDLDAFSEQQLLEMFGRDREIAPVRWYALGVLLMEREDLLRGKGREPEFPGGEVKALAMLLESFRATGAEQEPGHTERIGVLLDHLAGVDLPETSLMRIAEYYESTGRYAKAEDVYCDLVERATGHSARLSAFYERLLGRSDEELERGNLPRREVLEGLVKLRG